MFFWKTPKTESLKQLINKYGTTKTKITFGPPGIFLTPTLHKAMLPS